MSYAVSPTGARRARAAVGRQVHARLQQFLCRLLAVLDAQVDHRSVRTLPASVAVIPALRHRAHGLLLSELGAYLAGPAHAPAGTKRLSNLLCSSRWSAALIERFLWQQMPEEIAALRPLLKLTNCRAGKMSFDERSVIRRPAQPGESTC